MPDRPAPTTITSKNASVSGWLGGGVVMLWLASCAILHGPDSSVGHRLGFRTIDKLALQTRKACRESPCAVLRCFPRRLRCRSRAGLAKSAGSRRPRGVPVVLQFAHVAP